MGNTSIPLSFRIPADVAEALDRARGGQSRGELAKQILIAEIKGLSLSELREEVERIRKTVSEEQEQLQETLGDVRRQVDELRIDLATSVVALLVSGKEAVTKDQAERWVEQNLHYHGCGKDGA